ncbi:MAG: type VI secretion system tube protein Hcp [Deltaproteobacteria bacterium]|nr:type VI secretion system tube protein Hcp [Deltaproteobacteria bacterium]
MSRSRTHGLFGALALVGLLGLQDPARADQLFLKVTDQIQGQITGWYNPFDELGGVSLASHGLIEHLSWSVVSPRDAASGLPTGKRQHKPLVLGLRMSDATILLANSLFHNSNLPQLEVLVFARDPDTGVPAQRFKWLLTNANVASYATYTVREDDELVTYVDLQFTYQKIGLEDSVNGISVEDDWETPIAAPQLP